jgi:hypothetical protein
MKTTKMKCTEKFKNGLSSHQLEERYKMTTSGREREQPYRLKME